jgi:hypothetical protein
MSDPSVNQTATRPISRDLYLLARYWLGQRRVQLILAVVLLGGGAWFQWNWLVAAGIAPLLLAFAPCAVMCVLGMCMHKGQGKASCHGGEGGEGGDKPGSSSKPDA